MVCLAVLLAVRGCFILLVLGVVVLDYLVFWSPLGGLCLLLLFAGCFVGHGLLCR